MIDPALVIENKTLDTRFVDDTASSGFTPPAPTSGFSRCGSAHGDRP